ncbi:MAG TPA: hypothetical protein PK755_12325 [Spirochaetota bacterium]|nr:hypothetical protein [Spirochaetota bacterium]
MTKFSFSRFLLLGIALVFTIFIYLGCSQQDDKEERTTTTVENVTTTSLTTSTIMTTTTKADSTSTSTVEQATTTTMVTNSTIGQQTTTTIKNKPIIQIKRNDDIILSGSTIDLGAITFGASIDITFKIENIGTSNLTLINNLPKINITGDFFTLKQDVEYSVIPVDSSADFIINFKPLENTTDSYNCAISIPNDTETQNPFVFNIICNVLELNVFKVIPNPVICSSSSINISFSGPSDKASNLLIPVFTGMKNTENGELIGDVTPDATINYHGYFLNAPVLLKCADNTKNVTDDSITHSFKYYYYHDNNQNKKIDNFSDTIIATATVNFYDETYSSGKWYLSQAIVNPFDPNDNYKIIASGIFGGNFMGTGVFYTTGNYYNCSGEIAWSTTEEGLNIKIRNGNIIYNGTKESGFINLYSYNSDIILTTEHITNNESYVLELVDIDLKKIINNHSTTYFDNNGIPTKIAFQKLDNVYDKSGNLADYTLLTGKKNVVFNSGLYIGDVTISDIFLKTATSSENSGHLTLNISDVTADTMNKNIKAYIFNPEDIIFNNNYPSLKSGASIVQEFQSTISNELRSTLVSDSPINSGFYYLLCTIDMSDDTDYNNPLTYTDDYLSNIFGLYIDGDASSDIGNNYFHFNKF